ncbi:MAG: FAD-dependent oxidoreductase [Anaerolineaceae bacterium]|nr:FAD-dependent oxidoreductase [Anaerolineaceae bacterium]
MSKPSVIIIGAGFTGVATAHDLAQRGFAVTVVERGEIASGTSGRTHGLLHSGARYAVNDQESAIECIDENLILRKIVPDVIEPNGGLFVGINDSDLAYVKAFCDGCEACHIPVEELNPQQVLRMEPALTSKTIVAYTVPDGTFDPLRLALAFAASSKKNGARYHTYTEVEDFLTDGNGNVVGIKVWDRTDNTHKEMRADVVVNATGAWVGELVDKIGANVPIKPTPGVMVAYDQRLTERVINRLNAPSDGDIILPQRRMMVTGTTSFAVEDLDYIPVDDHQVDLMLERGSELLPALQHTKVRGAYMATRPLIGSGISGRSIARTFKCYDHKESDHIDGIVTITGGKATTLRAMAEKTADIVCQKLGVQAECMTKELPLSSYRDYYRYA